MQVASRVGTLVRQWRTRNKVTQKEFCEMLEDVAGHRVYSQPELSMMERGITRVTYIPVDEVSYLAEICDNIQLGNLIGYKATTND